MNKIKFEIKDNKLNKIIKDLLSWTDELYLVGGAVRDLIMERTNELRGNVLYLTDGE